MREAVEGYEPAIVRSAQDDSNARHPVSALAVYQVADNFMRTPRPRPFIPVRPLGRKVAQQRLEYGRGTFENLDRTREKCGGPRGELLCRHTMMVAPARDAVQFEFVLRTMKRASCIR